MVLAPSNRWWLLPEFWNHQQNDKLTWILLWELAFPETNSKFAPENRWLEYDRFLFGTLSIFRSVLVSFKEGRSSLFFQILGCLLVGHTYFPSWYIPKETKKSTFVWWWYHPFKLQDLLPLKFEKFHTKSYWGNLWACYCFQSEDDPFVFVDEKSHDRGWNDGIYSLYNAQ